MPTPDPALASFHPIVQAWFAETLGAPSAPQRAGWPAIAAGHDTLVLAPTGTGKTLAAFLWELNALIEDGLRAPLANAVHLLYVSPLKALNNDVQRNLEGPLAQLRARFEAAGARFPEIRVGVRTGDTKPSERARMLRRTPHVLITTPESLHILLTSVRGRTMFSALRAVIVDEIHAVAGSKRGAHLAVTLERLAAVAPGAPQRIGLSATQRPLDEVARFLGGCDTPAEDGSPRFRPVEIVDCGLVKRMETRVVSPVEDLAHVDGSVWLSVAPLVRDQIRSARTTLVFVNNRAQAERMAARVNQLAGEELALPYHGSLSRERRFLLEERLKAGELRAVITTSSLELGIDVGSVDLVVQLQSPKRVAAALQRVGRAGHTLGAVSRGVFVPTFRDDALEQLAILDAMRSGDVEPTVVVQNALDVLAQLVVAMVASEDADADGTAGITSAALFDAVRRAYPFHRLTRAAFDEVLAMLSGRYPSDVAAELEARVLWDRVHDVLTPTRGARLVATMSGGTIPDRGLYTVHLADRTRLGELDEEFVHESRVGDAFQLGSSTWRIARIEHDRVVVAPAPGAAARTPFWHGEFMARSAHLAPRVGALRARLDAARTGRDLQELAEEYRADDRTVQSLVEYVQAQRNATGHLPTHEALVLEHFRDEVGSVRAVLHAPFGGRVTAPWGMAVARRLRERLGTDVQVQTSDDGLMIRMPDLGAAPPLDVFTSLDPRDAERLILEEVGASSLFGARFRMNAARALLLPRGRGRRTPLWLQRLKSADLLEAVRAFPSFPIVVETYREVLQDAFDLARLQQVLAALQSGAITVRTVRTEVPSPFAASLQFGFMIDWMYGDDAPRAERRAAMLSLDTALLDELMGGAGADEATLAVLDDVLARRRGTAPGRQARDADELALLVERAGDVTESELQARVAPPHERRGDPIAELLAARRLVIVALPTGAGDTERRYLMADAWARYAAAFGRRAVARVETGQPLRALTAARAIPAPLRETSLSAAGARSEILRRFLALSGPVAVEDVVARYEFDPAWTRQRLDDLARLGTLVRGTFTRDEPALSGAKGARWVSRRLLERARRRELALARRAVEAVPPDRWARFLLRWQHATPDTRVAADDVAQVVTQLDGIARPLAVWERDVLPSRMTRYDPSGLSRLVASGAVAWAVVPPADPATASGRIGALRLFARGTGRLWLGPPNDESGLSTEAGAVLAALRAHGASFTGDLEAAAGLTPRRTRDALRELVAAGLVTNDTIEALRDAIAHVPVTTPAAARRDEPDPTRWLPAGFTPSPGRPVVQRRTNVRRLPKWQRPDRPVTAAAGAVVGAWGGRWSLVHAPGVLGPELAPEAAAELVARRWLARYGVVSRDWWRRERPAVPWADVYGELKRLEFRGEVRRGYFVQGLAGAQFALPEAVEALRAVADDDAPMVVLASADPGNAHALPLADGIAPEPLARGRGPATLVVRDGRILLSAESRGRRVRVRPDIDAAAVQAAAAVLAERLAGAAEGGRRDLTIDTIDGEPAAHSPHTDAFRAAGFRSTGSGLRWYAGF